MAKKKLRKLLIAEGAMRRRDDLALGNFYQLHFMTYYIASDEDKTATINHIKAKIVRL